MTEKLNAEGVDPRLTDLVGYFVDTWIDDDFDTRDIWLERIQLTAIQHGFEFEPALRKFLIYILVGSKRYSALSSVKKSSYPKRDEIAKIIVSVSKLIDRGASKKELAAAADAAYAAADAAVDADVAYVAAAAYASRNAAYAAYSDERTPDAASRAVTAAAAAARAADDTAAAYVAARREFASALLYFVEQQAQGRRRSSSTEKVPSLEKLLCNPGRLADASAEELIAEYDAMKKSGHRSSVADMSPKELESAFKRLQKKSRKSFIEKGIDPDKLLAEDVKKVFGPRARVGKGRKLVIDKAPLAKDLIAECRALWESYCERPGKVKLRKVEKHCDAMKGSRFKTVKDERRRCMDAVRREKKKLGMA